MGHNPRRAQRMCAMPTSALLDIYLSGSLSSSAAGAELIRRGVPLPTTRKIRRRVVEVIYGPVPVPPLRELLQKNHRGLPEHRDVPDPAAPSPRPV
ncbi:hypothetical protein KIKIMORA_03880 [Brevundimonas phage vB_BpoS-Kikimora]|uniref:Uncharacterized protein n=1 Tax=Brevundimonas phage vB_BpoS-Kikimora TaxID=2948601 RepID=A0A9E7MRH2_9CAUD|nr:hypothetical protein KIKIMORA_03880 [Brevundimonas phage vB_BpoS-Kikimora]